MAIIVDSGQQNARVDLEVVCCMLTTTICRVQKSSASNEAQLTLH